MLRSKVERAVVARCEHGEPWPFATNVYSSATHRTYRVHFSLGDGGSTWPVTAWTTRTASGSWVQVYHGN